MPRESVQTHEFEVSINLDPFDSQLEVLNSNVRFPTVIAGVRYGKTELGSAWILEEIINDEPPPEKPAIYWIVAPTYKMLRVPMRAFWQRVGNQQEILFKSRSDGKWQAETRDGKLVEFKSAEDPDGLRGPGVRAWWLDEGAYTRKESADVLRTRVTDTAGRGLVTTTPRGKNWIHNRYLRGIPGRQSKTGYRSWRFPTSANPHIPAEEIEQARQDLPEALFRQEYMAEFMDDSFGVFRVKVHVGPVNRNGRNYAAGLDIGRYQDYTAMVVDSDSGMTVEAWRDKETSWSLIKERVAATCRRWPNLILTIDSSGAGDPIREDLEDMGIKVHGFNFANAHNKMSLITALQLSFEAEETWVPEEYGTLIDELQWYEQERTPSGNLRFRAPPGLHDDYVIAKALSNWTRTHHLESFAPVILDGSDVYPEAEEEEEAGPWNSPYTKGAGETHEDRVARVRAEGKWSILERRRRLMNDIHRRRRESMVRGWGRGNGR